MNGGIYLDNTKNLFFLICNMKELNFSHFLEPFLFPFWKKITVSVKMAKI